MKNLMIFAALFFVVNLPAYCQLNTWEPTSLDSHSVCVLSYTPGFQAIVLDGNPIVVAPQHMRVSVDFASANSPRLQESTHGKYGIQLWNAKAYYARIAVINEGAGSVSYPGPEQECPLYSNGALDFPQGDSTLFACDFQECSWPTDATTLLMRRFYLENVDTAAYGQTIRSVVESFGESPGSLLFTVRYRTILPTKWMVITSRYLDQWGATAQHQPAVNLICALGLPDDMLYPSNPQYNDQLSISMFSLTREWNDGDSTKNKKKSEGVSLGVYQADDQGYLHSIRPCMVVRSLSAPVSVTLETDPPGLPVYADSVLYHTPHTLAWLPGSNHLLNSGGFLANGRDTQYVFASWSDNGLSHHTITVPDYDISYRAHFIPQFKVAVICDSIGGTVTGSAYYDQGAVATLTARPKAGFTFVKWMEQEDSLSADSTLTFRVSRSRSLWGHFIKSDIVAELSIPVPMAFALEQNYPNPFNPKTVISSQVPVVSEVRLTIYDLLGREVAVLVNERRAAGTYHDSFDASTLASGVYLYRMTAGNFVQTRKMIFIR